MSELRRGIIRAGNCAEGDARLFARLDTGSATPAESQRAIESCNECRRLGSCRDRLHKAALYFARIGVRKTVFAGIPFESQIDTPMATPRRLYTKGIAAEGYATFLPLSDDFLEAFAQTTSPLELMRSLGPDKFNYFALYSLKAHTEPIIAQIEASPPVDLPELDPKDRNRAYRVAAGMIVRARDSLRIRNFLEWSEEEQQAMFHQLTTDYLQNVKDIHGLQIYPTARAGFLHSSEYCQNLIKKHKAVSMGTIRNAFRQSKTPHILLERYEQWLPRAQAAYGHLPTVSPGIVRSLTFKACRHSEFEAVERFFEDYLERHKRVEELSTYLPFVRPGHVRHLSLTNRDPEKAVAALLQRVETIKSLAHKYGLPARYVNEMALAYRKDIEGKLQRYQDVKRQLMQFKNHRDVQMRFLEHWALRKPFDGTKAVDRYLGNLAFLREKFSDDEDFDDTVMQQIAFRYPTTAEAGAFSYKEVYTELRLIYAYDDVLEDWMLRLAATRGQKGSRRSLGLLRASIRNGLLRVSLDAPTSSHSDQTYGDTVADSSPNPEESFIAGESTWRRRVAIEGSLLLLDKTEREAVIHSFGFDWLFDETIADRVTLCQELNISPNEFDQYVAQTILPKLQISELRDLL